MSCGRSMSGALLLLTLATTATAQMTSAQPAPADQYFDSNGVRIRYVEQGQGTPVILIHGYTGTLDRHWTSPGVLGALASNYRVIALDCRGHGKSGKPADPKAYGPEMAQDVVRLLDHLRIPRAHVIGYSMGAMIAGHLLTTNADRVLTATFVGYHPSHTWTAAEAEEAEASARELEGDLPFRSLVLAVSPPDAPRPSDEQIRQLSQPLVASNDLKALAAYHRGRAGLVVTDAQLQAVRVPTLGIIGTDDPSVDSMRALKTVMPAMTLVIVDGATHGGDRGVMRRPEFMAALKPFLAANSPLSFDAQERFLAQAPIVTPPDPNGKPLRRITLDDGTLKRNASVETADVREADGRDYRLNIAAYELDKMLGLNLIPATVERNVSGRPAALTWWLDDVAMSEVARRKAKTEPPDRERWTRQMQVVRVFDELVANAYRDIAPERYLSTVWDNLLITRDWSIWLIDHTRTFQVRSTLEHPESLVRCDRSLLVRLRALNARLFGERLGRFLSPQQIEALESRRQLIVQRFDELTSARGEAAVLFDLATGRQH